MFSTACFPQRVSETGSSSASDLNGVDWIAGRSIAIWMMEVHRRQNVKKD